MNWVNYLSQQLHERVLYSPHFMDEETKAFLNVIEMLGETAAVHMIVASMPSTKVIMKKIIIVNVY